MSLIERYLPVFQFREEHSLRVDAPAASLLAAALRPGTTEDPWVRIFIGLREIPARLRGALGLASGLARRPPFGIEQFLRLGQDGDRELAFGLVGRFWRADYGLVALHSPAEFERYEEPGVPKLVLNISAEPAKAGGVWLRTETRVYCNDRASALRFTPYWLLIRPVSGLIRRRLLLRIARAAEANKADDADKVAR